MAEKAVVKSKPTLMEVGVSVSTGGKIQIKKYEVNCDYHFTLSGKWAVPEDMTEDQAADFRHEQILRLRQEIEPIAQEEVNDLMSQKNDFS